MRCVQVLSALALRRLLLPATLPVEANGAVATASGPERADFPPHAEQHIARAMRQANARAWMAVEILLAGEAFWERAQLLWQRDLEADFFRPIRDFLDGVPLDGIGGAADARAKVLRSLETAIATGLLTFGAIELEEMMPAAEPCDLLQFRMAEWRLLGKLAEELEQAGYAELRPAFELPWGDRLPLLVLLVASLFRLALETDLDLFGPWGVVCVNTSDPAVEDFRALAAALDKHRALIESLLKDCREPKTAASPTHIVDTGAGALGFQRGLVSAQRGEYEQAIGEFTAALQLDPSSAEAHVRRGDAHRLQGNYAQALVDYGHALRLDPACVAALVSRGQVHWMMRQEGEAVADFTAALELEANNAAIYHLRGKAYASAGDFEAALVNFSEALRLDPFHAWAYHDCGDAYADMGNYDLAIANYSESLHLNPLATLTYLRQGKAYAAKEEFDRAIASYGNVLRLDPRNFDAYLCRGVAFGAQGKFDQAAADFTRALEFNLSNPELFFERGLLFQHQGNHERARMDFDAAINLDDENAQYFHRRGLSLRALGEEDGALEDQSQAVRLDPDHAQAYYERGSIYALRGEFDLALADFTAAVEIQPDFAQAYMDRAKTQSRLGFLEEARADCDLALENDDTLAPAYLVRGSVLAQQGQLEDAIDDFTQALGLDLHDAQVYLLRGIAHLKLNSHTQAAADLSEAIRIDPHNARAYVQRAALAKTIGQQELALSDLACAARLDTQHVPAYCCQLGVVHAVKGNHEWAVADYTIALMLNPENAEARSARAQAWKAYLNRRKQRTPQVPVLYSSSVAAPPVAALAEKNGTLAAESAAAAKPTKEKIAKTPRYFVPPDADESAPQDEPSQAKSTGQTLLHRAKDTAVHQAVQDTAAYNLASSGQDVAGDSADADALTTETSDYKVVEDSAEVAEDNAGEVRFDLNVPDRDDSGGNEQAPQSQDQDDQAYAREQELEGERVRRHKEEEASNRVALARKIAEEERRKAEAASAEAKAAKKRKQKVDDDYDDDGLPLWKKGVLAVAATFALWWIGTTIFGWLFSPMRNWNNSPRVAFSGKAVLDKTGKPLAGVWVAFNPEKGGDPANAQLDKQGKFSAAAFPGSYVVTFGTDPEVKNARPSPLLMAIPADYRDPKSSPLKVEVNAKDNSFDFQVK